MPILMKCLFYLALPFLGLVRAEAREETSKSSAKITVLDASPVPAYDAASKLLVDDPCRHLTTDEYKENFLRAEDPRLFHKMTITYMRDVLLLSMTPKDAQRLGQVCRKLEQQEILIGKESGIYAPVKSMFFAPQSLTLYRDPALIQAIASLRACINPISVGQFKHYPADLQYKTLIDVSVDNPALFRALDMNDVRKIALDIAKHGAHELASEPEAPDLDRVRLRGIALAALGIGVSSEAAPELQVSERAIDALITDIKVDNATHAQRAVNFLAAVRSAFPLPRDLDEA